MTHPSVPIQNAPQSVPTLPCWFAEVAIVAHCFTTSGLLTTIEQPVRFSRPRFGTYEVLDFVVVLLGYTISAEPTLLAFYDRVTPFAVPFMALFHRQRLPHRATLSRFLAALDAPCVEALRVLFQDDLITQTAQTSPPGGLWDRLGHHWLVMDVDGTKQAARQRALPQIPELPPAHRRFDQVCAPGYLGRKRGEVEIRTRTTVLQAHSHHWLGTFGGPGNGDYRGELARACEAIIGYAGWLCLPVSQILVRLDGLDGNAVVISDRLPSGLGVIVLSQRLRSARSSGGSSSSAASCQHDGHPPGEWSLSYPLRLPGYCTDSDRFSCSLDRCHAPSHFPQKTVHWSRPCPDGDTPCFSPQPRRLPSRRLMCWISICIGDPSRRFSPMKIGSKIQIGGVLTLPTDRNSASFCINGFGIVASRLDTSSRHRPCVSRNLHRLSWLKRLSWLRRLP